MSPQQSIEMHFNQIMRISRELGDLTGSLQALETEVSELSRRNKTCWSGECARILAGKEVKIAGRLGAEAQALLRTAGEMEDRAKRMYQSEMMNIHLAAARDYR